jgi:hypothetical protein
MIRQERKKAKDNKAKYTGVSSNEMGGGGSSNGFGSSRYGGFGSASMSSSSGGFQDDSKPSQENDLPTRGYLVSVTSSGTSSKVLHYCGTA